ncbi:MAG TPA: DNA repair exonuclease [Gemmatimonadales bacterium]|nr:DNA repair exonuclease [Gemmatimonadales bacterium]
MKLAHLADLHLGFRQYHRQTASGLNQREADVANAFRSAVDGVIAARPDAVVLAGDIFHSVRPSNPSILFAYHQLARLRSALPDAPVVLIAGNHDTPRSSETGSILGLFSALGVDVVADESKRLVYPALGLSVLAVPHVALISPDRTILRPQGSEPNQVLLLHGEVEGVFPADRSSAEYGGAMLAPAELNQAGWNYVALGHYHVQHQVGPKAWYSGALEYVSPNPWGELAEEKRSRVRGKGWLLVDLPSGEVESREVALARRVMDLEPINASALDSSNLDQAIAARIAEVPGGIAGQVVRLVVREVPRHLGRELDHAAIRGWKAEALNFHLDLRRPESYREIGMGAPGSRQTLTQLVQEYLSRRLLPGTIDREEFVRRGVALVQAVEQEALEA